MTHRTLPSLSSIALAALLAGLVVTAPKPAHASIFGEENVTLVKQLTELLKIRKELELINDGIQATADAVEDSYRLYYAAQGAWEEISNYGTDDFLRDFKRDLYRYYPGFELVIEGKESRRLKRWSSMRPRSPVKPYELISVVFADLTDPMLEDDDPLTDAHLAEIFHAEAAAVLLLHQDTEEWLADADKSAAALAELAEDPDLNPGKAQIVQARALALIATQNSHTLRLLSRRTRLDGLYSAIEYGRRLRAYHDYRRHGAQSETYFRRVSQPPTFMRFERLF